MEAYAPSLNGPGGVRTPGAVSPAPGPFATRVGCVAGRPGEGEGESRGSLAGSVVRGDRPHAGPESPFPGGRIEGPAARTPARGGGRRHRRHRRASPADALPRQAARQTAMNSEFPHFARIARPVVSIAPIARPGVGADPCRDLQT